METHKKIIFFLKNAYLSVSVVMFCKQFLAYTVLSHAIYKHSSRA